MSVAHFCELMPTTRICLSGREHVLCMVTSLRILAVHAQPHAETLAMPGAPCGRSDELKACSSCAARSSLHVCYVPKAGAPGSELPQGML